MAAAPTASGSPASPRTPAVRPRRVVVAGGAAAGMTFAARARRLDEDAEVVVLERGDYVSFANCGLPYHIGGQIAERDSLLLRTTESLRAAFNLDVRVGHEMVAVDPGTRTVSVRHKRTGGTIALGYDALVLAAGADPLVPPIAGIDDPAVHTMRSIPDAAYAHAARWW